MSYRVGQVLYVVLHHEMKIYPMQVVEEVSRKTLEGQVTTYMVRGGPNTKDTLAIDDIKGEIFDSAAKVQKALIDRVTQNINAFVEASQAEANEWYPGGFEEPQDDELASLKKGPTAVPSLASQGTKSPRAVPKKKGGAAPEVAALAAELQADNEKLEVEMPDGTRVRVNSIKVPDALQG